MQLNAEQIEAYAKKFSRLYISRYGSKPLLDENDAFSIAYIAIAKNNTFDDSRSPLEIEKLFKTRAVNAILREYQNSYGLRRNSKVSFVPIVEFIAESTDNIKDDSFRQLIESGLKRYKSGKSVKILLAILDGGRQSDVARQFEVTESYVSKLFNNFKNNLRKLMGEYGKL